MQRIDYDNAEPFLAAVKNGSDADLVTIKNYIANNKLIINILDDTNHSAIFWAAQFGHREIVLELLAVPELNIFYEGILAIEAAISGGHIDIVEDILKKVTDIDLLLDLEQLVLKKVPIEEGANNAYAVCIRAQIEALKKDNIPTLAEFFTAADIGGEAGLKTIEKFIEVNKHQMPYIINSTNSEDETVLIFAASKGHAAIVAILVTISGIDISYGTCENIDINVDEDKLKELMNGFYRGSALMWAVCNRHAEVVRILAPLPDSKVNAIEIATDDEGNYNRSTALMEAIVNNDTDTALILLNVATILVNILVEKRCNTAGEKQKISAIILAARMGNKKIFFALVERSDINLERDGIPALKEAVKLRDTEFASALVEKITDEVGLNEVLDSLTPKSTHRVQKHSPYFFLIIARIQTLETLKMDLPKKGSQNEFNRRMNLFRNKKMGHTQALINTKKMQLGN